MGAIITKTSNGVITERKNENNNRELILLENLSNFAQIKACRV